MKAISSSAVLVGAIGLLLVAMGPPGAAAEKGYKVIVHPSNPVNELPREQVARRFLGKMTSWPSGAPVAPVDLARDSAARAAFSQDVLRKSVTQVIAYWQQQIYSGRAVPPPEKQSDAEVVAFVEGNEGAIGYVSEGAGVGGAKVVRLLD